jgi:transketolase
MHGWGLTSYARRAEASGWQAIEIDGHDVDEVDRAITQATGTEGRPTVIVARTHKGKGVKAVDDKENAHGKPVDDPTEAIAELGGERHLSVQVPPPAPGAKAHQFPADPVDLPRWETGTKASTRRAYGDALAAVGAGHPDVVALDAEVSNSTYAEIFKKAHPERFFEMFIAEQQMVAAAVGMQVRHWRPFASTFAAFFTRAYDFARMAAVSRASIRLVGSHAGVSIGQDGPSQMGLEDLASFRAVHGSTVLYPSDPNQTARLVEAMVETDGVVYMRTTRGDTPVLYEPDEEFRIGGSRVLRSSESDQVTVVAAGITLHEAVKAADVLAAEDINVRLIDLYSLKPVDSATLAEAARATEGRIVTVEDHWPEGGIGETVLSALADCGQVLHLTKLAVEVMPTSGTPDELLGLAGIDAEHIAAAVRKLAS